MNNFTESFPKDDKKYRCCCGSVHIKHAAIVVGIVMVFGLLFRMGLNIMILTTQYDPPVGITVAAIVVYAIDLMLIGLLFFGIWSKRRYYMLPQIIVMIVGEFVAVFVLVGVIFNMAEIFETDDIGAKLRASTIIGIYIISLILNVWFIYILYRCWIYLKDFRDYKRKQKHVKRGARNFTLKLTK